MADLNLTSSNNLPAFDLRPEYFVKMFKDGSYDVTLLPFTRAEAEHNTMELEYLIPEPTEEEKLQFALQDERIKTLPLADDQKREVAKQMIKAPDFEMLVTFDPNKTRAHDDPDYFFKTPCKPVIWSWVRVGKLDENGNLVPGSIPASIDEQKAQAVAVANAYRESMITSGKWDMVVNVYKQQYNVIEG